MTLGIVGKKIGMTRLFTEAGKSIPVTVVKVPSNRIVQVKNTDTEGYTAVQVAYGEKNPSKLTKPLAGHYLKHNVQPGEGLLEFRLDSLADDQSVGAELNLAEIFTEGNKVDVQGVSKGKGFAGTVKRHNFSTQDNSHGNSLSHRAPGSVGQTQTPGRVWKGKKMAGHLGNVTKTVQKLELIKIDEENNLLLIKGGIPGHNQSTVIVKPSVKSRKS